MICNPVGVGKSRQQNGTNFGVYTGSTLPGVRPTAYIGLRY
jgi:hypothetical protein